MSDFWIDRVFRHRDVGRRGIESIESARGPFPKRADDESRSSLRDTAHEELAITAEPERFRARGSIERLTVGEHDVAGTDASRRCALYRQRIHREPRHSFLSSRACFAFSGCSVGAVVMARMNGTVAIAPTGLYVVPFSVARFSRSQSSSSSSSTSPGFRSAILAMIVC